MNETSSFQGSSGNGQKTRYKEIRGVVNRNDSAFWTRIGVAFPNSDGSWHLKFDYMPVNPEVRVHLFDPRERDDGPRPLRGEPASGGLGLG